MALVLSGAGTIAGINATNGLSSRQTGEVLQMVQGLNTTFSILNSTTLTATGITATITPKFASSNILILVSCNGLYTNHSSTAIHFEVYKNGTSLNYLDDIVGYGLTGPNFSSSYQYLDSPASTSALTYSIYWKCAGGTINNIGINNYISGANRTISGITLMAIAA